MALLRRQGSDDIIVVEGGFVPDPEEVAAIMALGVRAVFDTDTRIDDVVAFFREAVREVRTGDASPAGPGAATSGERGGR